MNPELYTDEFRNFKFLKSPPAAVEYYKIVSQEVSKVQRSKIPDPNFKWSGRVEFFEQLFDLRNDAVYLVYDIEDLSHRAGGIRPYVLHEIKNPIILTDHPVTYKARLATYEDIPALEHIDSLGCLCSAEGIYMSSNGDINPNAGQSIFRLSHLPVVPNNTRIIDVQLFNNKEIAQEFCDVKNHLLGLKISGILPAFSGKF